jgi:hypothetical protein
MTIRVTCDGDGCGVTIDRDAGGWFGVDYQAPPVEAEPDEDGMTLLTEIVPFNADHEFHFHSPDCLVSWAFSRSFTPQQSEGTTT